MSVSPLDTETMEPRETANHSDPTQADDELGAQNSVIYKDFEKKRKKKSNKKNKLRKITK